MIKFVWVRHPTTGGVQKLAARALTAWQEAGWEPCDPPAEPNLALATRQPKPSQTETPDPPAEPGVADPPPAAKPDTKTRRPSGTNQEE